MKKFYTVMALMATMVVGGLFASCEKEKNNDPINASDLIGTWRMDRSISDDYIPYIFDQMVFTKDTISLYMIEDSAYYRGGFNYYLTSENDIVLIVPTSDNGDTMEIKGMSVSNLSDNQFSMTFYFIREDYEGGHSIKLCNKGEHNTVQNGIYKRLQ